MIQQGTGCLRAASESLEAGADEAKGGFQSRRRQQLHRERDGTSARSASGRCNRLLDRQQRSEAMKSSLIASLAVLGMVTGAHAGLLATAPLVIAPNDLIACSVRNTSDTASVTVTIKAVAFGSSTTAPIPLGPGQGTTVTQMNTFITVVNGYCEFDVDGPKRVLRAAGCAYSNLTSCQGALPAE
jgi:hypothetical protein